MLSLPNRAAALTSIAGNAQVAVVEALKMLHVKIVEKTY